jgi:hypothetical protein
MTLNSPIYATPDVPEKRLNGVDFCVAEGKQSAALKAWRKSMALIISRW